MAKETRSPHGNGPNKAKLPMKRERTVRISDEDWEDIRRAAKAVGKSAGDFFVDLHRRKGVAKEISPSEAAMRSALALLMTQLTRAIVQQDGLPDNSFEVLLELQRLMQRIIETK